MKIALLYEHPNWSDSLLQCFAQNAIKLELINIAELAFDTANLPGKYDLVINRVNIMPSPQRKPGIASHTLHFLKCLEYGKTPVINGASAHFAGASKALQNVIFSNVAVAYPKTIAVYQAADALSAAESVGYPLIIKPNIGGSGSGVAKYDSADVLRQDIENKTLDFGIDRTAVVQEYIESDGFVYRVEILGDRLFYAIKQKMKADQFNYCAADGCHTDLPPSNTETEFAFCAAETTTGIEVFNPDAAIVEQAVSIIHAANADLGGVEYLLDQKTGLPCYYDFNPYSNFVSGGERLLGFSPEQQYVNFVMEMIKQQKIVK